MIKKEKRQVAQVQIGERLVTIKELTIGEIEEICTRAADEDILTNLNIVSLTGFVEYVLPFATDLTLDEIKGFAPSALKTVIKKFKEVNADFFFFLKETKQGIKSVLGKQLNVLIEEARAGFVKFLLTSSYNKSSSCEKTDTVKQKLVLSEEPNES